MKDDAPVPVKGGKGKKAKEGEEEMTVVVPPAKNSKSSTKQSKDKDGDVAMVETEKLDTAESEDVKIDPVAKTISGRNFNYISKSSSC